MKKPVIMYVDDEPHNLTVFESAITSDWIVQTYDNPLTAMNEIAKQNPWVVVSDQRMPGMVGVDFLEIVRRIQPDAKRVLVTGYSEEDLIIDSVRKAQVHDYIRKPWDVDDLDHRLKMMVDAFVLEADLREKAKQLEIQNRELTELTRELKAAKVQEETLRKELEAWAPPYLLKAIYQDKLQFPLRRDLAMITFDIVGSCNLHGTELLGKPVRSSIIQAFTESVIRHGGWRESHSGDSAYAHFGALNNTIKPAESALAAASEFRMYLRNLRLRHGIEVECGIGLHIGKNTAIQIHSTEIQTTTGMVQQRSFDSSSSDVDLVHRIEKMTHRLPGSNIIMTEEFQSALEILPDGLIDLGKFQFKGQAKPVRLSIKPSDKLNGQIIDQLRQGSEAVAAKAA